MGQTAEFKGFVKALERGDPQGVIGVIEASARQVGVQQDGWLHHALSSRAWWRYVPELLRSGHAPNISDAEGRTALDCALQRGLSFALLGALLRSGARFGPRALEVGWVVAVLDYKPTHERTGAPEATNFEALVLALRGAGFELGVVDASGLTALDLCFRREAPLASIEVLLSLGVVMSKPDESLASGLRAAPFWTRPLAWFRAAARGGFGGVHWEAVPAHERAALRSFFWRVIAGLLRAPLMSQPPLLEALLRQDSLTALELLRTPAVHGARGEQGTTALMYALFPVVQLRVVEALIERKVDVNQRRDDGLTALMMLCALPSIPYQQEAIALLLAAGAEVQASEPQEDMTPLLFAIREGRSATAVKLLLEAGASPAPTRRDGQTARDFAESVEEVRALISGYDTALRCRVGVRQFAPLASYRAEEPLRGSLLLSSQFALGRRQVLVRAQWRPLGRMDWRQANAASFSGEVEVQAGEPRELPFSLEAPAGPFSREAGQLVHEWRLCVEFPRGEAQPEILVAQSGQVEFSLSPGLETSVGEAPRLAPLGALRGERSALDEPAQTAAPTHVFVHADYRLELSLERGSYQIGETLRGAVKIDALRVVSCRGFELALTRYLVLLERGMRSKLSVVQPLSYQLEELSPRYAKTLTWSPEEPTRCAFSVELPALPVSFSGRRYRIEWELSFTADVPWALDPSVSRVVQLTPGHEALTEGKQLEPTLHWPREGQRAWFGRRAKAQQRWEALGAVARVQPNPVYQGGRSALSLSLVARDFTRIAEITATLCGAEREDAEDWCSPLALGLWRQEELSLCGLTALAPGQRFEASTELSIPVAGPASFSEGGVMFAWWVILTLRFVDAEPLQVALSLQVAPRLVSIGPFR